MKKIFTLALLALCTVTYAQNDKRFTFGVAASLTGSAIQGHVEDDYHYRTTVIPALLCELHIKGKFYIQGELYYATMGGRYIPRPIAGSPETILERDAKVNYIALPIKARYYVEKGIFFELGVQVDRLVYTDITETYTTEAGTATRRSGLTVKPWDFGPVMGLGWRINSHWAAQASLFVGRINMFENDGPAKVHNQNVMIGASYYL